MKGLPKVSVLVLNHNGREVLEKCLQSLFGITDYPDFDVVVIDNASTDGSLEIVKKFKKAKIVRNKENVGFVIGNNVGMDYAVKGLNPEYVLLLNNDTEIVSSGWLARLVNYAEDDKDIGIIGCRLVFPDGRTQWSASQKTYSTPSLMIQAFTAGFNPGIGANSESFVGEANSVSGACMMIRADLLKRFGYLSEDLAPYFGEDVEICYRARKNGYKVFYAGDVKVAHRQSYTFVKYKNELQRQKFYWSLANGVKISRRYFGFWRTLVYGMPIFSLVVFFERRDRTRRIGPANIRLRGGFGGNLLVWLKIVRMVLSA